MQLARVIGTVVSTQKNLHLEGAKLLLVQPIDARGAFFGNTTLAVDVVGSGVGERVLVVNEGRAAAEIFQKRIAPVDSAIIGIVDELTFVEK